MHFRSISYTMYIYEVVMVRKVYWGLSRVLHRRHKDHEICSMYLHNIIMNIKGALYLKTGSAPPIKKTGESREPKPKCPKMSLKF